MALTIVKEVLVRAAVDPQFRTRLIGTPEEILAEFELTPEERQCLSQLTEEQISAAVSNDPGLLCLNDIRI